MPAPLAYRRALATESTDEDGILLAVISRPEWPAALRFADQGPETEINGDAVRFGVTSGGVFYEHAIKSASALPGERPNQLGIGELILENVETDAGALVDPDVVSPGCTVTLSAVAKSDPDQVISGPFSRFVAKSVEADNDEVRMELGLVLIEDEAAVAFDMDKHLCPALHP